MKAYSLDLRQRVLTACDAHEGTRKEIAKRFKVSEDWIYKLLRQRREIGSISPQYDHQGRKPIFQGRDLDRLKALVDRHPDATLEELRELSGKNCSIMAVFRALDRLGQRYKKRPAEPANKTVRTFGRSVKNGSRRSKR